MEIIIPGPAPVGSSDQRSTRGSLTPVRGPWFLLESSPIAAPSPSREKGDKGMQRVIHLPAMLAALALMSGDSRAADYAIGADLSFLNQAEERGTVFKEDGRARPGLQIFKDHGY